MTYSIVVYDSSRKLFAVGVVSGSLAVGSRVPWARAGVAAVATQAYTNPVLGKKVIEYVSKGMGVGEAVKLALSEDSSPQLRQLVAVDSTGKTVAYSGSEILTPYEAVTKEGYACAGNLLRSTEVVREVCRVFEGSTGNLSSRIISALEAGHEAGGDRRGDRSAAILIVGEHPEFGIDFDVLLNLRVDYSEDPLTELRKLYDLWLTTSEYIV